MKRYVKPSTKIQEVELNNLLAFSQKTGDAVTDDTGSQLGAKKFCLSIWDSGNE